MHAGATNRLASHSRLLGCAAGPPDHADIDGAKGAEHGARPAPAFPVTRAGSGQEKPKGVESIAPKPSILHEPTGFRP